jgi:hypothetical protein
MRKLFSIAVVAIAASVLAPVIADAHMLSPLRAKLAIKRAAISDAGYGFKGGSMLLFCGRRSAHLITCDILFTDADGDAWCGGGRARLVGHEVRARARVGMEGCEYF